MTPHPSPLRSFALVALPALAALAALAACSRTELYLDGMRDDDAGLAPGPDGALPNGPFGPCEPSEETCNGLDDDCNGQIDDLPPIPCPGGGARYCVGGHYSECPKRCDVCMPGSTVVCFNSYCNYWGSKSCAADGRSWSGCAEDAPPPECAAVAKSQKYSAALEQCCIDHQYCCRDEFDLDGDGDTGELLGRCDEVLCGP